MRAFLANLINDEQGVTAVEYGLLAARIAPDARSGPRIGRDGGGRT